MYTMIERRKPNPERVQEAMERADSAFFPQLKAAPGFRGFYLVPDEAQGIYTTVIVFASKAQFEAFMPVAEGWQQVLEEMGHKRQSDNRGETVIELEGER